MKIIRKEQEMKKIWMVISLCLVMGMSTLAFPPLKWKNDLTILLNFVKKNHVYWHVFYSLY